MYVLTYDATVWANKETTDKIILLDGTPVTVEGNEYISSATVQPVGVLGVYYSEAKARKTGKAWLYDQLTGLGVQLHLPLPIQDGSETTEPDWRRSGWQWMADGSWDYTISDRSRDVGLTVIVTGRPVADEDEDEDDNDNDNDHGDDDDEYWDSDDTAEKQEYMLVGPVGRRRRVVKTGDDDKEEEKEEKEEKEEADGEGAGDSNTGGGDGVGAIREEEHGNTEREGDDLDIYWDQNSNEGDLEGSDAPANEIEEAAENKMKEVSEE